MNTGTRANLFALVEGFELRLVPTTADLQSELIALFAGQAQQFFADSERVPFSADYSPSPGEIQFVEGFQVPEAMKHALENPLGLELLVREELSRVRGFLMASSVAEPIELQVFDRRRLLSSAGFSLILAKGVFYQLEEAGVTLDSKLTAVVQDGCLYFHSFDSARRLFDLTHYFKEATDADLATFQGHERVHFADPASLAGNADSWVRKKIAMILESGILDLSPRKTAEAAKEFEVEIAVKRVGRKEKISLPGDKKQLKTVLRFLGEDYLFSSLTDNAYLSNSKRPLPFRHHARPARGLRP